MSFGEKVKGSWENKFESPSIAHMEEYTLIKLASEFQGITPEDILKTLNDSSLKVSGTNATLKIIATENKITPARVYEIITLKYKNIQVVNKSEVPSGIGKITLMEIATRLEKDPSELIKIIKENGVEANGETTMRTIADQLGMSPYDLYSLLADN